MDENQNYDYNFENNVNRISNNDNTNNDNSITNNYNHFNINNIVYLHNDNEVNNTFGNYENNIITSNDDSDKQIVLKDIWDVKWDPIMRQRTSQLHDATFKKATNALTMNDRMKRLRERKIK